MIQNNISSKLISRIATGLVRIDDIVENRRVYGGIALTDSDAIKQLVNESIAAGLDYNDTLIALQEYFTQQRDSKLNEVGTVGTVATTGTPTTGNVANTAPTSAGSVSSVKPITPQGIDSIGAMLKNAGLNPSQLSQVIAKAK